jgi:hypothetical protein
MKIGATVVLASLAIVLTPAVAAYGQGAAIPAGNDVSYPQCGITLPMGQAFGIVAVNDGLANTTNPCLAAEIAWAQTSTGAQGVTDWPQTNYDPFNGHPVADPYGSCTGGNNPACAWQYGWDLADLDALTRGVESPGSYLWWLDVETINSWQSSAKENRADVEGMASYFRHIGAGVGIYSTAKQWDPIVGTVPSSSPLYRLPDWIPGAKTLSQAKKNCRAAPLTGGGEISVTQLKTSPTSSDLSCRALSQKKG